MLNKIHPLFWLICLGIFLWPACEDDEPDPVTCLEELPVLGYSASICSPDFLDVDYRRENPVPGPDLKSSCPVDGPLDEPVYVALEVPANGVILLHQYLDHPVEIQLEVFGGTCPDDFEPLEFVEFIGGAQADVCQHTSDVFNEWLIRLTPEIEEVVLKITPLRYTDPMADEETGEGLISLAAFDGIPTQTTLDCDPAAQPRIIVSSGPDTDLGALISRTGLPVGKVCDCAEPQNLIALDLPPRVDLEGIGGKLKTKENTKIDTGDGPFQFGVDYIVEFEPTTGFDAAPSAEPIANTPLGSFETGGNGPVDGMNVRLAILDSGVDYGSQPDFDEFRPLSLPANACTNGFGPFGFDLINYIGDPADTQGHGTNVAGVAINQWPGEAYLEALHLRFYGTEGALFDGICGFYAAAAADAQIVNASWGVYVPELPEPLGDALGYLRNQGVVIVTSAGNLDQDIGSATGRKWPGSATALYDNILTVASYFYEAPPSDPTKAYFSNFSNSLVASSGPYAAVTTVLGGGMDWRLGTSISTPFISRQLAAYAVESGIGFGDPAGLIANFLNDTHVAAPVLAPFVVNGAYFPVN